MYQPNARQIPPPHIEHSISKTEQPISSSQLHKQLLPEYKRNKIFIMFLLADLFLNYDSGVIPVSLLQIEKEVHFSFREQALLGSLVYLGLSCGSLFTSQIFSKYSPTKVCTWILIINSICCFAFSLTSSRCIFFATRFLMGITEAFVVVYGPIWVNNYSPKNKSTTWMGILHSCTVFGMITGYIIAGIIINCFENFLNWRFAIQIQGIANIPLAMMFYVEDENFIDLNPKEEERNYYLSQHKIERKRFQSQNPNELQLRPEITNNMNITNNNNHQLYQRRQIMEQVHQNKFSSQQSLQDINNNESKYYFKQASEVLSNPLYVCVTLTLCCIYFIVTGIQFWMTSYLIQIINGDPIQVVIVFSFSSISAPLLGILTGGTFADKYGGYKGKNTFKAIQMCTAFGFISFVFAFPLGFLFSFRYVVIMLWVFLFFGAALVPICTGIMISCVKTEMQATSSSLSQLIFNLFGYFLSPFLTGFVMDCFENKRNGFIWGMRIVFWWVILAMGCLIWAFMIEYQKKLERENSVNFNIQNLNSLNSEEDELEEGISEFIRLEIRRRMALSGR